MQTERVCLGTEASKLFGFVKRSPNYATWAKLVEDIGCSNTTLKACRRGKRTLTASSFEKLIAYLPANERGYFISKAKILDANWGAKKGGKYGIVALRKKYGIEQFRRWRSEWAKKHLNKTKKIRTPEVITPQLAEFIGACLGDGTMTKYFVRIFGDKNFDRSYFQYLANILKETFGIEASIRTAKSGNLSYLEVCSKELVDFLQKEVGLPSGDKIRNRANIPEKILANQTLTKCCLRGLMDTDGSFCRRGTYMCLAFTSHNTELLAQVSAIGHGLGYFSYHSKHQAGTNSWKRIRRYFSEVGSSNLKQIVRFSKWVSGGHRLYQKEVLKYFPEYLGLALPYTGPVV